MRNVLYTWPLTQQTCHNNPCLCFFQPPFTLHCLLCHFVRGYGLKSVEQPQPPTLCSSMFVFVWVLFSYLGGRRQCCTCTTKAPGLDYPSRCFPLSWAQGIEFGPQQTNHHVERTHIPAPKSIVASEALSIDAAQLICTALGPLSYLHNEAWLPVGYKSFQANLKWCSTLMGRLFLYCQIKVNRYRL